MSKFCLDYVHNNPAEEPFHTKFNDPLILKEYGFNGQVLRNIHILTKFEKIQDNLFPKTEQEKKWYIQTEQKIISQIQSAKKAGLQVFFHIDPLIFPKNLIDKFKNEFTLNGSQISASEEFLYYLYGIMFDEICSRFPQVDGFIVRVGETYLFDCPHHLGGCPVSWYNDESQSNKLKEQQSYISLINFLKDKLCWEHNKILIFRTWDCFHNKMHSDKDYYLDVVNKIQPDKNLYFSIKHTQRDFWRYIEFNPCLGQGSHKQIIEIQSQREYEGKGAFANYSAGMVLQGFPETKSRKGIADIYNHQLISGIFHWSRGGGWYGPYLKNEFWCDFNSRIIAEFAENPQITEEEIFYSVCRNNYKINDKDAGLFRKICLLSQDAVLKGIYCNSYDTQLVDGFMPANLWFRDDRLGGAGHLEPVFNYLFKNNLFDQAIAEKEQSVDLWQQMHQLYNEFSDDFQNRFDYVRVSIDYGLYLFSWLSKAWKVMALGYISQKTEQDKSDDIKSALKEYDQAYNRYLQLSDEPESGSLFRPVFWNWPLENPQAGLEDTVNKIRKAISINV